MRNYYHNYAIAQIKDKYSIIKKAYTLLLLLMPIICQYKLLPLATMDIFCLVFGCIYFLIEKGRVKLGAFTGYYFFLIFGVILSSFAYGDGIINSVLSALRLVAIFIGIFCASKCFFLYEYAKKVYYIIALIISVTIFVQEFLFYIFGKATFWIIPNATLNYGNDLIGDYIINSLKASVNGGYIFRPMSVFLEPAYCGYYLVPAVILLLFSRNEITKKSLRVALIITVSIILTTSITGIISVVAVWGVFVFKGHKYMNAKIRKYFLLFSCLVIVAFIFVLSQDAVQFSILRKLSQLRNTNSSSSTSMRLFRGWDFFTNMRFGNQILGCGFGHLGDYYFKYNLENKMDYVISEVSYMNSIFSVLCSAGILGFALYIGALVSCYRISYNLVSKMLVVLLIMFLCAGAVMDIPIYYVIIALITSHPKTPKKVTIQD